MQIIAHRGWWKVPEEKNTMAAFRRCADAGFGIETDFRDCDGTLVISHDMPTSAALRAEELFALWQRNGCPGTLALNIKADGLQTKLIEMIRQYQIAESFFFDMSVPDSLLYLGRGMEVFTRESEYESPPSFLDSANGVWVDCFNKDWVTPVRIDEHLKSGKKVCLVSSELHSRDPMGLWKMIKDHGLQERIGLMLCTDYPMKARRYFNGKD